MLNDPLGNRQQSQHPTLAAVIEPEDDRHVLKRHDDRNRPEHHRQNAEDVLRGCSNRVRAEESFLEGVKRRRSDIAENHPQRSQHHHPERLTVILRAHAEQTPI